MSDTFGLLELPIPVPTGENALSDPALDMVLAFIQAVLNAQLGPGWAARSPADPIPVAYVFPYAPDPEVFNADETPALFLWRSDDNGGTHKFSQDLVVDEGGLSGLWVPPPMVREDKRLRESIKNGFKKALKQALAQGRHPAWKIPGDDYYDAQDYGSVLLYHAKLGKCRLGKVQTHTLIIESEDKSVKTPFDALFFTVDTMETFDDDVAKYQPLASASGTVFLGDPSAPLTALPFIFDPAVTALDVTSGPAAGGTAVVIAGAQFPTDLDDDVAVSVIFDDAIVLGSVLSETEIAVTTPAHPAGPVDVSVLFPSGVRKTLAGAFTFT